MPSADHVVAPGRSVRSANLHSISRSLSQTPGMPVRKAVRGALAYINSIIELKFPASVWRVRASERERPRARASRLSHVWRRSHPRISINPLYVRAGWPDGRRPKPRDSDRHRMKVRWQVTRIRRLSTVEGRRPVANVYYFSARDNVTMLWIRCSGPDQLRLEAVVAPFAERPVWPTRSRGSRGPRVATDTCLPGRGPRN